MNKYYINLDTNEAIEINQVYVTEVNYKNFKEVTLTEEPYIFGEHDVYGSIAIDDQGSKYFMIFDKIFDYDNNEIADLESALYIKL